MTDVAAWLKELGLERYEPAFRESEITTAVLPELTEADLKELGLPLGPRKLLLRAIASLTTRSAPEPAPVSASTSREAERRQLTVLFCDLVGSTELSAQLDPEDMGQVIRAYQGCCAEAVERWGGHVAKYMGDGVLAYFGWPQAHEDEAERAVRAGLAIVEALARLETPAGDRLAARIGIATGLVMVGEVVGEGVAQEQTVVGETPNLAARLQALAAPGSVVISQATRRLVGELFELADLGPQRLKGFAEPLSAWRVEGEGRAEGRFEALHGEHPTPLVGREHELGILLERWAWAKDGDGQVALVSGEPGIGKSRLIRALRERLGDEPYTPVSQYCSPYHTNSALYPVIGLLERAAQLDREELPEAQLTRLEGMLARSSDRLEVVPLLAALIGVPTGERYPLLTLTPEVQKRRTLQALVDQLAGLAMHQPVLALYEDVHWADPSTLELLGLVIERIRQLPVLVLITSRPEFQPPWTGHAHVTTLNVGRLGRRQGADLLTRLTGAKPLPSEIVEQIVARTDGVPLFVEELTKTVLESGLLVDAGDRFDLVGPLPLMAIPATLRDSLMARLDRLAPVKEIAQIGAVIGREFPHELLAAVADQPESELNHALDQLVASALVFRRSTSRVATYSFKHALVQETAYQSLLKRRRQQLHARVATALLQRAADAEATNPEVLAHHFTEAGLADEALPYWLEAGERANARFALAEAIAHLTKGLDLVESLPDAPERATSELALLIALGPPLMVSKGLYAPEVERLYARANELAQQVGYPAQRFAALWGLWHLMHGRADFRSAPLLADDLMTLAEGQNDADQCLEAHHAQWTTCFFRGELVSAAPHLAAGCALYDPKAHRTHAFLYGGHDSGTCCRVMSAMVLALRGYPTQAMAAGEAALRLAHELDNPPNLAYAQTFGAHLHQFLRDGPTLLRQAKAGMALAVEQGTAPFAKVGEMLHGWARMECGAVDEGAAQLHGVLARARARKKPAVMLSYYLTLLADACGRVGDHREGLAILADALDMMEVTDERLWEAELYRLKGEFLLREEGAKQGGAERCFRQAAAVARRQEARLLELRAATSLARLWAEQGRRADAQDLLTPVYGWFTEGFDTADLKDAKALLDELD